MEKSPLKNKNTNININKSPKQKTTTNIDRSPKQKTYTNIDKKTTTNIDRSPKQKTSTDINRSPKQKTKVSRSPSYNKNNQKNIKYDGMCIEQICTCGKHECPKNKYYRSDFGTTYQKAYQNFDRVDYDRIQDENERYKRLHRSPLNHKAQTIQNLTEMKAQYTPKRNNDPDYNPVFDRFRNHKDNPYDKTSTVYQDTIGIKKQGAVPASQKPDERRTNGELYVKSTIYRDNYTPKKGDRENVTPQKDNLKLIPNLSIGTTLYRQQYVFKDVVLDRETHDKNRSQFPRFKDGDMKSTYMNTYKQPAAQYYDKEGCPIQNMPIRSRECSPGKQHLYYNAEYNNWG